MRRAQASIATIQAASPAAGQPIVGAQGEAAKSTRSSTLTATDDDVHGVEAVLRRLPAEGAGDLPNPPYPTGQRRRQFEIDL